MSRFTHFVDRKQREHERAVARHAKLRSPVTWRMRLRVHIVSKINSEELQLKGKFLGRRIVIKSRKKGEVLKDADGIVFQAWRFKSAEAAAEFGFALQAAVSAIGTLRSIPVDVGFDNAATSMFSDEIKDAIAAKEGFWIVDDVHGVQVYPDTQTMMVTGFGASVTTSFGPNWFLEALDVDGKKLSKLDENARQASLLINAAFMAPHPVAMLTLGVASIELLAKTEKWNANQKAWIKSLRSHLTMSKDLTENERAELKPALDGLNRFGALESTRRLFLKLGLGDLLDRWEVLYQKRSRLFHGSKLLPSSEVQFLGGEARELSKAVFAAYVSPAM